ncbi:MAG: xanthine dehydrogenase family protein molybdopterin-binding subunit [Rhodothermales bacterium]|nr:xanthine dehydrogenase family protein molybdopterin-binding subunit [Rhodothermales bacterium]MBO6779245.1 xanthine dehydrogenase family protein molybdopterin-binding subunit [Rhodothermales bacterium]
MYALELSGLKAPTPSESLQILNVSRRRFLKTTALGAGSVFVLGVFSGCRSDNLAQWPDRAEPVGSLSDSEFQPNVFIGLNTNGDVFLVCSRSEMGQGIRSSVPAVIADEMGADWDRCHILQADGHPRFGNQNTDGSRSIRNHFDDWRRAGASARLMLLAAAAETWQTDTQECRMGVHEVLHSDGRRLSFGELAQAAASQAVPSDPVFRPQEEWRYIGTDIQGRDNRAFVTGSAEYGIDVQVPDMVHAAIQRSPVMGGRLRRVDDSAARAVPGVRDVVVLPDATLPPAFQALGGVAVIADNTWAAFRGRDELVTEWEESEHQSWSSAGERAALESSVTAPGNVVRESGDVDEAFNDAAQTVEAVYHVAMLPHAPMEPPNAVAHVKDDGSCEVWAPSQAPQTARASVAGALGVDPEQVTVHVTFLGGGFGRKSKPDYCVEAALLSRAVGAPVKVTWSREDDLRHDYFHPPSAQYMKASLDASGQVTGWLHRVAFPTIGSTFQPNVMGPGAGELSSGARTCPYVIPSMRVEACEAIAHQRIGWLRSVYNIQQGFSVNAFASEIAHASGRDAREVLLELIGPDREMADLYPRPPVLDTARLKGVINLAADEAGWGRELPPGHGMGIAGHFSFSSYVAHAVHASVENGQIRVHRVDCAVDCGIAVNLDRIRSQMEGAVVFGLTLALKDGIEAADGAVTTGNFDTYRLLALDETPETHVHIVESRLPAGGVGEPGVPPLAPALTGAILQATGTPVRTLPIRLV